MNLSDIVPQHYLQELARAADEGELCMIMLLDEENVQRLQRGQATLIKLETGAVFLLVPSATIRAAQDAADAAGNNGGTQT